MSIVDVDDGIEPEIVILEVPIRQGPGAGGDPEDKPWPPSWPPVGDFREYCTVDDTIDLLDNKGGIVCRLSRVCVLYRSIETNWEGPGDRVTVGSYSRVFQKWNNWIRSGGEKNYASLIEFTSIFFEKGHFDSPAHRREFPSGKSQRLCGVDQDLGVAGWPREYKDIEPNYLYPRDPLPGFDERGYLRMKFYLCSKHCGMPPI